MNAKLTHEQTVDLISTFTSVDAATIRKMTRVEQGVVPDPKLVQRELFLR
jgi:hypothetical protein